MYGTDIFALFTPDTSSSAYSHDIGEGGGEKGGGVKGAADNIQVFSPYLHYIVIPVYCILSYLFTCIGIPVYCHTCQYTDIQKNTYFRPM